MNVEKIFKTLKSIKPHTYISLVLLAIVIINYVLTAMGQPIIDLGEEEVTYAVNTILNLVFIGYAAYKNQSVTENARMADKILYALRDGKLSKEEVEKFIEEHRNPETPTEDANKTETVEAAEATDEEAKG